jgi:hypothetical protein
VSDPLRGEGGRDSLLGGKDAVAAVASARAHKPDCDFFADHYWWECSCGALAELRRNPPAPPQGAADPAPSNPKTSMDELAGKVGKR